MPVKLTYRNQEHEVPAGMTVRDAMKKVGLSPETTLATRKGQLLTDDEILKEGDQIKLIAVISGGSYTDYTDASRTDSTGWFGLSVQPVESVTSVWS